MKERASSSDRYLVVLGSNFRKEQRKYYFSVSAWTRPTCSYRVRDFTGDRAGADHHLKNGCPAANPRDLLQV
jgi:hypothetical protein